MKNAFNVVGSMRRFLIFNGGSLLGACIDYVITLALHETLEMVPWIALGLAMLFSAPVVFVYHEHVTFRMAGERRRLRLSWFSILAISILLLRTGVLEFLIIYNLSVCVAMASAIIIISVLNFIASSALIFRNSTR